MNIRSFSNLHHFVADQSIYGAQMILLQETWQRPEDLSNSIDGYINSFNSGLVARGNGIASYYKDYDIEIESAGDTSYQITKLSTAKYDVINVYFKARSTHDFLSDMDFLITNPETTVILETSI